MDAGNRCAFLAICLPALLIVAGCGENSGGKVTQSDTIFPANVRDLYALPDSPGSMTLTWTASGDDGTEGTASSYDIRYTTDGSATWGQMTPVQNEPPPVTGGERQTFTVGELEPGTLYRFQMRVVDEESNISGLSNQAAATTMESDADLRWSGIFAPATVGGRGMDGPVIALAEFDGALIAGGRFTTAGGTTLLRVARWNGEEWQALGTGFDDAVSALSVYDGRLVAGGLFTRSGESEVPYVAIWDGLSWEPPEGGGADGPISAITVIGTDLFVAGSFGSIGGVAANRIARFDGRNWHALGSGLDDEVSVLAEFEGDLVAGGFFTHAGGDSAVYIARWDGGAWRAMGLGRVESPGTPRAVFALAVHDGSLFAGGNFLELGGDDAPAVARWDGGDWSPMGGISPGDADTPGVQSLLSVDGALYIAGRFSNAGDCAVRNIVSLTAGSCTQLGSGLASDGDPEPVALALLGWRGELYVGGSFQTAGHRPSMHLAQWRLSTPVGSGD